MKTYAPSVHIFSFHVTITNSSVPAVFRFPHDAVSRTQMVYLILQNGNFQILKLLSFAILSRRPASRSLRPVLQLLINLLSFDITSHPLTQPS